MRTILLALAALAATPGLLLVPLSSPDTVSAQQTVTIEAGSDYFCDPTFFGKVCETTVDAGDTVTWNNVLGVHTVTECDATHTVCPPPGGGFDSGTLTQGESFSHTFPAPGSFNYYCAVHPDTMQGRIVVLQATATPVPTAAPTAAPTQPGSTPAPASPGPATSVPPAVSVPSAGGPPGASSSNGAVMALLAGGLLLALAAVVVTRSRRG